MVHLIDNILHDSRMSGKDVRFLLKMQYKILIDCYNCIKNKNFDDFDALVTDTNCQVRALKIVSLMHEKSFQLTEEDLKLWKQRVEQLLKFNDTAFDRICVLDEQNESIIEQFKHKYDITISKDLNFLLLCKITDITRYYDMKSNCIGLDEQNSKQFIIDERREVTNAKKLFETKDLSFTPFLNNYISHFISNIQSKIMEETVYYLKDCFENVKIHFVDQKQKDLIQRALLDDNICSFKEDYTVGNSFKNQTGKVGFNKVCISCFYGTQIVIEMLRSKLIPIVLIISCVKNSKNLVFTVDPKSFKMQYFTCWNICTEKSKKNQSMSMNYGKDFPCFVIEARHLELIMDEAQFQHELVENFTLDQILREEAAQHPQFVGKYKNDRFKDEQLQQNIEYFAQQAHLHGFSKTNSKMFLISHMYPYCFCK